MSNTDEIVSFLYSSGENAALNALQTEHNVDKVVLSSDSCHAIRLRASVSIRSVSTESMKPRGRAAHGVDVLFAFICLQVYVSLLKISDRTVLKSAIIFVSYKYIKNSSHSVLQTQCV